MLPLPVGSSASLLKHQKGEKLSAGDQEQLQPLESAALTWTQQIKQALNTPGFESLSVRHLCLLSKPQYSCAVFHRPEQPALQVKSHV